MIDQNQFIYQQWRQNAVKRAYAHLMNTSFRLQNVARCVAVGGNPAEDPDIKDDYFFLVNELGETVLLEEVSKIIALDKE